MRSLISRQISLGIYNNRIKAPPTIIVVVIVVIVVLYLRRKDIIFIFNKISDCYLVIYAYASGWVGN